MALSPGLDLASSAPDHGFHELGIAAIVRETHDAATLVLDVPTALRDRYRYEPGQFLTFRVRIDGRPQLRSYSMSSAPGLGEPLQVTVKRVAGGLVSNWMLDTLSVGDVVEATRPAGIFGRRQRTGDIVAVAGGSGVTPVLSVLRHVLATTTDRARVFYANRDPASVIFGAVLDDLAYRHPGRLDVVHHHDSERGLVTADELSAAISECRDLDCYVCGPAPFMELAESVLLAAGAAPDAVHIERFTPSEMEVDALDGGSTPTSAAPVDGSGTVRVAIELDGRAEVADYRPGTTLLQTARQRGLSPPFSCEAGNCATCMARLLEGAVTMSANNALTEDEVADGWILTCQSVPTTPLVRVRYGWDEG